jgi:hypothetical protein
MMWPFLILPLLNAAPVAAQRPRQRVTKAVFLFVFITFFIYAAPVAAQRPRQRVKAAIKVRNKKTKTSTIAWKSPC